MRPKVKKLVALILVALIAIPITVCSFASAKKKVTLTVGMPTSWKTYGGLQEMFKTWQKETGNQIDIQAVDDTQYVQQLTAKLASGDAFDVIFTYSSNLALQFNPTSNFVDLSKEPWVTRMSDVARNSLTFGGKVYGAAFAGFQPIGVVYNKKVFKDNSLKVPKTQAELDHVCAVLKSKGITPIYFAGGDNWPVEQMISAYFPDWWAADSKLVEKLNKNQIKWDKIPGFITMLNMCEKYRKLQYYNTDLATATYAQSIKEFVEGKTAMLYQGTWVATQIKSDYPKFTDYGMFAAPTESGDNYIELPASDGIYIFKGSSNIPQSKDLIRFLCTKQNLTKFYSQKADISAWKDVITPNLDPCSADVQSMVTANKTKQHWNDIYQVPYNEDMCQIITPLLMGRATVQDTAKAFSDYCVKIGKQEQLPGF